MDHHLLLAISGFILGVSLTILVAIVYNVNVEAKKTKEVLKMAELKRFIVEKIIELKGK